MSAEWTWVTSTMETGADEPFWMHEDGYVIDTTEVPPQFTTLLFDKDGEIIGTIARSKSGWRHDRIDDRAPGFATITKAASDLIRIIERGSTSVDGGSTVAAYGEVVHPLGLLDDISRSIIQAILDQDAKWGIQDHALGDWQLIATEEDGEAAEAILKGRLADAEHELVQAMAVRLRMIEKVRWMAKGEGR